MKLILFGIALMLFGWIVEATFALEMVAVTAAAIGIIIAFAGLVSKEGK